MQLNTYLAFNGNCEQALTFYADIFDGKLELMRFRDAPPCEGMEAPPPDQIMHGCVTMGDYSLMGTDAMMSGPFQPIAGAHVVINVDSVDKAEELFAALSRNGQVFMPMDKTFWAERYGITTDRFGTPWMINCILPA
ncbi:MAG: VOC family protein [Dokdonella sp.]